jgi:hypothetical protein
MEIKHYSRAGDELPGVFLSAEPGLDSMTRGYWRLIRAERISERGAACDLDLELDEVYPRD